MAVLHSYMLRFCCLCCWLNPYALLILCLHRRPAYAYVAELHCYPLLSYIPMRCFYAINITDLCSYIAESRCYLLLYYIRMRCLVAVNTTELHSHVLQSVAGAHCYLSWCRSQCLVWVWFFDVVVNTHTSLRMSQSRKECRHLAPDISILERVSVLGPSCIREGCMSCAVKNTYVSMSTYVSCMGMSRRTYGSCENYVNNIRKKKSPIQRRPALDALRALGKILDSNLALIGSWHAGNSQHIASPSKRCARRGIYYPRRIPYSFPLQGSPEVELSCPRSASIQTLRQAVHQLPAQNT